MSAICPTCGSGVTDHEIKEGWCDSCGKRLPRNVATLEALKPMLPVVASVPAPLPASVPVPRVRPIAAAAKRHLADQEERRAHLPRKKIAAPTPTNLNAIDDLQSAAAWGSVRAGLTQAATGQFLLGICALIVMLKLMEEPLLATGAYLHGYTLLMIGFTIIAAVSALLTAFGMASVCAVPEESRLRRWAYVAPVGFGILLVCLVLGVVTQVDAYRVDHGVYTGSPYNLRPEKSTELDTYILGREGLLISQYGALAGWLVLTVGFFLFIQGVGTYFNRRGLTLHARAYLVAFGVVLLAGVGTLAVLDSGWVPVRTIHRLRIRHGAIGVGSIMMLWGGIVTLLARGRVCRAI